MLTGCFFMFQRKFKFCIRLEYMISLWYPNYKKVKESVSLAFNLNISTVLFWNFSNFQTAFLKYRKLYTPFPECIQYFLNQERIFFQSLHFIMLLLIYSNIKIISLKVKSGFTVVLTSHCARPSPNDFLLILYL